MDVCAVGKGHYRMVAVSLKGAFESHICFLNGMFYFYIYLLIPPVSTILGDH